MTTPPDHFDEEVALGYDAEHTDGGDLDQAVATLVELSGSGPALEFAIGTGRIALPLAATGAAVAGIELSEPMVARLREKPGGNDIPVVVGDMATARVDGRFSLVILVFNTICNLTTQEQQIACFQNAANHLEEGGRFVIETFVPPIQRLPEGETKLAFDVSDTHWGIDEYDLATQSFTSHHLWVRGETVVRRSMPFRYVWPSELDLMAQLAGMELENRWEDWAKTPFSADSARHVSVWRKT
ncbi:MAG: class I SAM-dependent methyltransferase [Pseudomonadota bacterium]